VNTHTVEKIGGTSMLDYRAVRDNIFLHGGDSDNLYGRVFVVSAYGGITNRLLEHKKSGRPGVYALFSGSQQDSSWREEFETLREEVHALNAELFEDPAETKRANGFIDERLYSAEACLHNLAKLCDHGHFSLEAHLDTVREMLASLGEAHSAWNTAQLLQRDVERLHKRVTETEQQHKRLREIAKNYEINNELDTRGLTNLRTVEPALMPRVKEGPKRGRLLFGAMLGGFGLMVTLLLLRVRLSRRLVRQHDVAFALGRSDVVSMPKLTARNIERFEEARKRGWQ